MFEDIKIDREKLYELYMDKIDHIADNCDWVTNFTPRDIISIISTIIELHPDVISRDNVHL